jgi:transcriptional regulator with XRE-family HTH domain/uncharacterized protein YjbI with pentapeptide repeats
MKNQIKIGELIAKYRKFRNLSQTELANLLLVSFQTVSKWERGESAPDVITLGKICEVLNINPLLFFKDEEDGDDEKILLHINEQKITTSIEEDEKPVRPNKPELVEEPVLGDEVPKHQEGASDEESASKSKRGFGWSPFGKFTDFEEDDAEDEDEDEIEEEEDEIDEDEESHDGWDDDDEDGDYKKGMSPNSARRFAEEMRIAGKELEDNAKTITNSILSKVNGLLTNINITSGRRTGMHFTGIHELKSAYIDKGTFESCDFDTIKSSTIRSSQFTNINLNGANIASNYIKGSTFTNANLDQSILKSNTLLNLSFINTNFEGVIIKHSVFKETAFNNCAFFGVEFKQNTFKYASFTNCSFESCVFFDNFFSEVSITNSSIVGSAIKGTAKGITFKNCSFDVDSQNQFNMAGSTLTDPVLKKTTKI